MEDPVSKTMKHIKPIYPAFLMTDCQLFDDQTGGAFYVPQIEDLENIKEGFFVKINGFFFKSTEAEGRNESTWVRVETVLPKYGMFIGRVISPVFVETVLASKTAYLAFYPENVAEIFDPESNLCGKDIIKNLLNS